MTCPTQSVVRVDPLAGAAYLAQVKGIVDNLPNPEDLEFGLQDQTTLVWRYIGDETWNIVGQLVPPSLGALDLIMGAVEAEGVDFIFGDVSA
jgi:hypothetical protein